jgi:hypothetical protein
MRYCVFMVNPEDVQSPKRNLVLVSVIVNKAPSINSEGGYSVALIRWDGEPRLAIRWNSTADSPIGNPQSRGLPTWFVIPDELRDSVLENNTIPEDSRSLVRSFFAAHQRPTISRAKSAPSNGVGCSAFADDMVIKVLKADDLKALDVRGKRRDAMDLVKDGMTVEKFKAAMGKKDLKTHIGWALKTGIELKLISVN